MGASGFRGFSQIVVRRTCVVECFSVSRHYNHPRKVAGAGLRIDGLPDLPALRSKVQGVGFRALGL